MANVAFYGGSFDPPHLGHVMVPTHLLLNDPSIDRVLIVPCHLQSGKRLAPFALRKAMCEASFGHLPRTVVDTIEGDMGGETITVNTLRRMKSLHPDWNLRFVMGADLISKAHTWQNWGELTALAPPLVIGRAGIEPLQPGDPTPLTPAVSSTIVREALRQGRYSDAERYLAAPVMSIIRKHALYLETAAAE